MNLVELFCHVDDLCQAFEGQWMRHQLTTGHRRRRAGQLCLSEIMTLLIWFHQSQYRHFKAFYQQQVCRQPWRCFSSVSPLWALCRADAFGADSLMRLSTPMPRSLHGYFVYRLDAVGRMSSPSSAPAPTLCRAGARGQKFDRLVFRLQAAFGRQ
jgi:hypothetical protein